MCVMVLLDNFADFWVDPTNQVTKLNKGVDALEYQKRFQSNPMELEGEDGSKIKLEPDADNNTVFGRGSGSNTKDRTFSGRHLLFTTSNNQTEPTSGGKNPVWVRSKSNKGGRGGGGGGGETGIRGLRRFERGDMEAGDCFCVCGQNPVWFTVKRNEKNELDLDVCVNASDIDPVKGFWIIFLLLFLDRGEMEVHQQAINVDFGLGSKEIIKGVKRRDILSTTT